MATFTTADLPQYNREQEVNMRFVVCESYQGSADDSVEEYGGDVVAKIGDSDLREVLTVKFEDEVEGQAFSHRVNGTVFLQEWAANEHARHRATASV